MLRNNWFSWIELVRISDRSFAGASESSGFVEVEQSGEFVATDADGLESCPQHVLLRNRTYAHGGTGHDQPFKIMYDKVDFYVEAILPDTPFIRNPATLPQADCAGLYSVKLNACAATEPFTFVLDSGALPPGFRLSADGQITGQPCVPGTYAFAVQLQDATPETVTKAFEITVGDTVDCCGGIASDFDGDDDIDHEDFSFFQTCYTGIDGGVPVGCECADLDRDGAAVGPSDRNLLELCATGPEIPPYNTNCDKQACCLPEGGCADANTGLCDSAGGLAQGPGTDCSTAVCEASEACCMSDGSCQDLITSECLAASGYPQGVGSDCLSTSCPQPQGCCLDGGDCQILVPLDCAVLDGVSRGEGSDCSTECKEACCYDGGFCAEYHPDTCLPHGTPQGAGTDCDPNLCP